MATLVPAGILKLTPFNTGSSGVVGEGNVAELDVAYDAAQVLRVGSINDRALFVEEHEDALGGGHGCLHDVVLLGKVADRLECAVGVLEECHQHSHRDCARQHSAGAVPDEQRRGQRR